MNHYIKIEFINGDSKRVEVECEDRATAIVKALYMLDSNEKENVTSVFITGVRY